MDQLVAELLSLLDELHTKNPQLAEAVVRFARRLAEVPDTNSLHSVKDLT